MLYWIVYILIYLPVRLLMPTKVIGKKNLPKGKALYASNHQSNFDIAVIACNLNNRFYALGKAELFKSKIGNWFFSGIGCIKIERGKPDIEGIKKTLNVLKKKDKPLIIFPTGTRNSSPEEIQEIKNGTSMFAFKSQAPIVPMVLIKKPRLFRCNKLIIGKPIEMSKYEGRVANKELYDEISQDLISSMQELLKQNIKAKKIKGKK